MGQQQSPVAILGIKMEYRNVFSVPEGQDSQGGFSVASLSQCIRKLFSFI